MKRSRAPLPALLLPMLLWASVAHGQARHWVGGEGRWDDPSRWSSTPDGRGGAGVPRGNEDAVIERPGHVIISGTAWCRDLRVRAGDGAVRVTGPQGAELNIAGSWSLKGNVAWDLSGTVRLGLRRSGADVDLCGQVVASDVVFDGAGSWNIVSDLHLMDNKVLVLRGGTVIANSNQVSAGRLRVEGRKAKQWLAGSSVLRLAEGIQANEARGFVVPGAGVLVVSGNVEDWGGWAEGEADAFRGINICGTGPGQTPFTIDAQLVSNYNGYGISCHGSCDGVVTVTVVGGVGPFAYQWINGPLTQSWNTSCGGNQIVIVTDLGQGIGCAATVQVTDPAALSVIFFGGTAPTCHDVCNGSRNAFAVGGATPYTYNWNSGAGTGSSFFQLCAGINTLQVTDANGCSFDTTFIFPVDPIQPDLTFSDVACFGECSGTAQVAPVGGTGTIAITWIPAPGGGQGTPNATGLCAGDYQVLLVDVNGCDTTLDFTINEPPPIEPNPAQVNASCFGACDGSASVVPTGAAGPFDYVWAPAPGAGQGTANATGLCAGDYTVTITDSPSGCDTTITITILSPPAIDPQLSTTDATCADACDGTATVAPLGGTPLFVINWSPAPGGGQGTSTATGLCPGNYQVTITDALLCDTTIDFTIGAPPPFDITTSFTDVTCAGLCDGTAGVLVSGGTPGYTYLWSPNPPSGQGTPNAANICAGIWSVLITDAAGCDTLITFLISEPPPLLATPSQTDVLCAGDCTGTASVLVSGGSPGYTYLWSPAPAGGQGTTTATGLCAGSYNVLVTDTNGCTLDVPFTILEPPALQVSLTVTDASCASSCDGSASGPASGGTPGYTYIWTPAPGGGQGTPNATDLCPGDYSLLVTDAAGCDTTLLFTIAAPPPILPNEIVTDATCAGDCDGSIVLAPAGGTGVYTYTWVPVPPNGPGTPQATDLCAGTYEVTIASGGCDTTITVIIAAPPPIASGISTTDATCAGDCDGTADVTPSGGTPGYTITWSPAPGAGQGTPNATGLCAGNYTVLIEDAAGCDTLIAFTINAPAPIEPNLTTTQAGCGTACDGTATAAPTGGTPGYDYDWQPPPGGGQGTPNATDLCPGVYTLTITDAAGCDTTVQFIISTPSGILSVPTITPASCADLCDGAIDLVTSGGLPAYTFTWTPDPGPGQGTANVSGLCPGTWTVQIGDQAGCDTTLVIDVPSPTAIVPNGAFTNETCNGPCDGIATFSPVGGAGGFSFFWTPAPPEGQGVPQSTQLCVGIWSVLITDAAGCDTLVTFEILPSQPVLALLTTTDATCAGVCDGTASVVVTAGLDPIVYTWTPAPGGGQGTPNATGLCAGAYTVLIVDDAGCDTTIAFAILEPPPILAAVSTQDEICFGPCTGAASVAAAGGSGTLSYDWQPPPDGGQGTTNATGLCTGVAYTVTVTDTAGCSLVVPFTIDPYTPIDPAPSSTDALCSGECNGTATVAPTGGIGPYTFLWTPEPGGGQGAAQAIGLCVGDWSVTVTDSVGCDTTVTFTIGEPPTIVPDAVVADVTCAGACDGSITLAVSGGTAPYDYVWAPVPGNGQGNSDATGLCAGTWTVTITDDALCDTTLSFTITEPAPLQVSSVSAPSQCQVCIGGVDASVSGGTAPYTFTLTGPGSTVSGPDSVFGGLCAGLYTLDVVDANGCSTQVPVPITDSDGEVLTVTDGSASCPGDCDGQVEVAFTCSDPACTIAWFDAAGVDLNENGNVVDSLCAGIYFVEVTNGSGCIGLDTVVVVGPLPIDANPTVTMVSCFGACDGSIELAPTGGTPVFTYVWAPLPGNGQGNSDATGLCAGTWDVTITDAAGCSIPLSVDITEPAELQATSDVTPVTCNGSCDGAIVLTTSGGTLPYVYLWSPAPQLGQGTASVSGLCAGNWSVTITDSAGCALPLSFLLPDPPPLVVNASATNSQCLLCNGTADASVSGGVPGYAITWTNTAGDTVATGSSLTALCAGLYTVTVEDANGCVQQAVVAIADTDAEVLTMTDGFTTCSNACNGTVSASFACSDPACTIAWYDAFGTDLLQSANSITDLCPGLYLALVTNASGCVAIDTALVVPAQAIIPNLSSTNMTCAAVCDGTATVAPDGGTLPYDYVWAPPPPFGQSTPQATGLCGGIWQVTITDDGGCDTTITVLITEPSPLVTNAVAVGTQCEGTCDGSISLAPQGGTGSYTYFWTPVPINGQGGSAAFGLCEGPVQLTLTDSLGCVLDTTFLITSPAPVTVNGSAALSECLLCNGAVAAEGVGGTAPYTYEWTDGTSTVIGNDSTVIDLCAGFYSVTVMDANGCTGTGLVPVSDADGEVLTMIDGSLSCQGDCDGQVGLVFNCSMPPCIVQWFDGAGNDLNAFGEATLDSLCAGTYYAVVFNGAGCVSIDTAFVTEPAPISANLGFTSATCNGACDGTAATVPTGGVLPYVFQWSPQPPVGQGTATVSGLCAGTWLLTVTDSLGCAVTDSVVIDQPDPILPDATITAVSCAGNCDGAIDLLVTGGTLPYTYVWTPAPPVGDSTANASGLCIGTWSVAITDAGGCSATYSFDVPAPAPLDADLVTTDNFCSGDCQGTADVTLDGGSLPYTTQWTDAFGTVIAQDTLFLDGLCAGDYELLVTDDNGCTLTTLFTVLEGAALITGLSVIGESCNGPCDGVASALPSNGAAPYGITWTDPFGAIYATDTTQVSALCAGDWTLTVIDDNGCGLDTLFTVSSYAPIAATATVQEVLCNGTCTGSIVLGTSGGIGSMTYDWMPVPPNGQGTNEALDLCAGDWSVTITDAAGCDTSLTFTIGEPPPLMVNVEVVTPASCSSANDGAIAIITAGGVPGYAYEWTGPGGYTSALEDLDTLLAGDYAVTVTDTNGCQQSLLVTVGAFLSVIADAGMGSTQCAGGLITLDGSASTGAVTYVWTDDAGNVVGDVAVVTLPSPGPGTHVFTLTVADGPCTDQAQVTFIILDVPTADAGADRTIFVNQSTTLGGTPTGPPGSTFAWQPDSVLNNGSLANPLASPLVTTWFTVVVTSPNGCTDIDSVLVTVLPEVVIPSGFSPNGDGWNDTWMIGFINLFPNVEVEIYNRWGALLFQSVGYRQPWDGRYGGGLVPVGTYYYVVKLNDPDYPEPYTGPLTVIR